MKRLSTIMALVAVLTLAQPLHLIAAPTAAATQAAVATVNLNSASVAELQGLPGIGKVTAEKIVAYRSEKGKFKSVDDLLKVKGVGKKSLDKIRPLVSVE